MNRLTFFNTSAPIHQFPKLPLFGKQAKEPNPDEFVFSAEDQKTLDFFAQEMEKTQQAPQIANAPSNTPTQQLPSCCATPSVNQTVSPTKAAEEPIYKSRFESLKNSKNPVSRWVGNILDWFSWFFHSLIQDFKSLFKGPSKEPESK